MAEHVAYHYWGTQLPVRLLFLFSVTGYTYMSRPSPSTLPFGTGKFAPSSPADNLKNGLVFTWAFTETVFWFMVYLAIRDDSRKSAMRRVEKRDRLD
jgi:hypothetical protein